MNSMQTCRLNFKFHWKANIFILKFIGTACDMRYVMLRVIAFGKLIGVWIWLCIDKKLSIRKMNAMLWYALKFRRSMGSSYHISKVIQRTLNAERNAGPSGSFTNCTRSKLPHLYAKLYGENFRNVRSVRFYQTHSPMLPWLVNGPLCVAVTHSAQKSNNNFWSQVVDDSNLLFLSSHFCVYFQTISSVVWSSQHLLVTQGKNIAFKNNLPLKFFDW